jgi:hypothetical protein
MKLSPITLSIAALMLVTPSVFAQKKAQSKPVAPIATIKPSSVEVSYYGLYFDTMKIGNMVIKTQKNVKYWGQ